MVRIHLPYCTRCSLSKRQGGINMINCPYQCGQFRIALEAIDSTAWYYFNTHNEDPLLEMKEAPIEKVRATIAICKLKDSRLREMIVTIDEVQESITFQNSDNRRKL